MTEKTVEIDLDQVTVQDVVDIRAKNERLLNGLSQQGVSVPNHIVLATRLETLLELFLTEEQRIGFEYAFETRMTGILEDGHKQVRQAQLTQGVGNAVAANPKLIVPGR